MVSVRNVSKRFGDRVVLQNVSLEVGEGEIVAIMGSSGGGKTTLLRCIAGLVSFDSGTVEVAGVNVAAQPELARIAMGMVFQSAALFDYLTVKENVLFGVRRAGKSDRATLDRLASEALETVGLEGSEALLPNELSGGMRKRVGVARALALKPKVMLYDEPITGLDPITAYTIDRLIVDVRDRYGVASLVVSHDLTSVVRTADRVAFLESGLITFEDRSEAFERSENPAIQEIVRKSEARTLTEI